MKTYMKILSGFTVLALATGCSNATPAEKMRADIREALEDASRKAEASENKDEALKDFAAIVKENPDDEEAALAYASALRENGFAPKAITVLSPHFIKSIDSVDIAVEYIKDHIASGLYPAAQRLAETWIETDIKAQRAADADPKPDKVYYAPFMFYELAGVSYDAQGMYDDAEFNLATALRLAENKSDKARVMNNLAINLVNRKKIPEALKVVSEAFMLAPEQAKIGKNLEWITELSKSGTK